MVLTSPSDISRRQLVGVEEEVQVEMLRHIPIGQRVRVPVNTQLTFRLRSADLSLSAEKVPKCFAPVLDDEPISEPGTGSKWLAAGKKMPSIGDSHEADTITTDPRLPG